MKRFLKITLWTILIIVILLAGLAAGFMYKVNNGFPVSYETDKPNIDFPTNQKAILLFSKTTGFRHGESIEASKPAMTEIAKRNNWFLHETEEGGVFNAEQLSKFKAVIFNNSTGRVLNDEQQKALENYVENGGTLIGIHGAGDGSHHWNWYNENFIGAKFSHHPLKPQFQEADVVLQSGIDSTVTNQLAQNWKQNDEWYIFFTNPRTKGFNIIYAIDGDKVIPNGNILWMKDKNFGMGKDHPVAWYKSIGKGKTFYTSMGHAGDTWKKTEFLKLIENTLHWATK
jgi:uncharacterized protein